MLLQLLSFLLEGVLQLVICCCGILGNTISILLLLGKHMKVRGLFRVQKSLNVVAELVQQAAGDPGGV